VLRQLVYPRLFVAQPDGSWRPSIVEAGSDRTDRTGRSASFRLRTDARWSNGTPITADDLRRTMDARFVERVDGPNSDGRIVAVFKMRLPDWRRLWSRDAGITPPAPDVYGGPFVVREVMTGLRTTLVPNPLWRDASHPFLDELQLVLTSDAVMTNQLLAAGQVDLVAPVADTVRTAKLRDTAGVTVDSTDNASRWAILRLNQKAIGQTERRRIAAEVPRSLFVGALLRDEARLATGFGGDDDGPWREAGEAEPISLNGRALTLVLPIGQPLAPLFEKTMENAVVRTGGALTGRTVDAGGAKSALSSGDYDLMLQVISDPKASCWSCHWSDVDSALAQRADGGDSEAAQSLERMLRDQAVVLPLWRENAVVAWRRDAVQGVIANGYESAPAWNAERWWRP